MINAAIKKSSLYLPPFFPPDHQMIHLFVEILDRYFGNVCELDIIFNFHKVGREGGLGG